MKATPRRQSEHIERQGIAASAIDSVFISVDPFRLVDAATTAAANASNVLLHVPLHDGAMRIRLEAINDDFLDEHVLRSTL